MKESTEGVTLAIKCSLLELTDVISPNSLTQTSHVVPPNNKGAKKCNPATYSEGSRTRTIWPTPLMIITFSEKLMYLEMLFVSARIGDVGSILRSQRFQS